METPQVSFKQVVSRGCGLDVHKKVVVATIDGEGLKKQTREFGTVTSSLKELRDWLLENGITHVAMESTGVFWKPVYNILEPAGITVWVVNAAHVKYVPGHKTDKKDSAWLCKLLLAGLLKPSYIPAKEQRELRDLTRYRTKLVQSNASNKNRIIRILEDANIKLSSVLSSTNGAVGTKLIDKMQDVDEVYHKKLAATKEEIFEACQGFITQHHVYMLQIIRQEIAGTQHTIESLTQRIKEVLSPYENALELLKKVSHRVITMHASDRYLKEGTLEDLKREEDGALGYAKRLAHGEIGKGLNDYDAIFTELKRVGFDSWISIEDGVDGMEQLERSVAFLCRKIGKHWG